MRASDGKAYRVSVTTSKPRSESDDVDRGRSAALQAGEAAAGFGGAELAGTLVPLRSLSRIGLDADEPQRSELAWIIGRAHAKRGGRKAHVGRATEELPRGGQIALPQIGLATLQHAFRALAVGSGKDRRPFRC